MFKEAEAKIPRPAKFLQQDSGRDLCLVILEAEANYRSTTGILAGKAILSRFLSKD